MQLIYAASSPTGIHKPESLRRRTGHRDSVNVRGVLRLKGAKQENLIITPAGAPEVTVDDLEVGQFVYLLLHNEKIRDVIDTIGKKGVLCSAASLMSARQSSMRYVRSCASMTTCPSRSTAVPATRDITETVSLLARMARFIIVDMTDPSSIPKDRRSNCSSGGCASSMPT
jgi:hypothetical protein